MTNKSEYQSADFIVPLVINGLHGRVMRLPAGGKKAHREILLIYGHHSALERMFSIAQNLAEYGSVTVPDLPGFGGMDSFFVIGESPTLDAMADYLATFIKLQYKRRPITIAAMSYGFLVATRMLQKYPELVHQVNMLVSIVGFISCEDFIMAPKKRAALTGLASVFSGKISAWLVRNIALQPLAIKSTYRLLSGSHPKMKGASKEELKERLEFEVFLWHANDVRTHMFTSVTMLNINLRNLKVLTPIVHVAVDADQYFDNKSVTKHMKEVFTRVTVCKAHIPNHVPTVISSAEEAKPFIPKELRAMLAKKPRIVKPAK